MIRSGDEPIPGYRVEERLGRGQYGEVWRATAPGRSAVALKFLDMTNRHGWKEYRSIQRVKRICHPHLMPIVALWLLDENGQVLTDDAVESYASEDVATVKTLSTETLPDSIPPARMVIATLLGDMSLRDRLGECLTAGWEGIPVDELIGYMQEAAKGIDHLNSTQHDWGGDQVGVQHCDIKPDNIMLTGGSVMICDFGVAQVLSDHEAGMRATSLSGSPAYMAPEAFEAKSNKASDQYSLAVTYYELRTGELPLSELSLAAAYDVHRSGGLDFSQATPREQVVLRRATHPGPKRRYASAAEFVRALRDATVDGIPRRKFVPLPAWLAAAAAVIAVAAFLIFVRRGDGRPSTVEVTLRFDAPGLHVLVNDEEFAAGPNGELALDAEIGAPLHVAAVGNVGRKDTEWTIAAADLAAQTRFDFAIPYTAAHHAAEAERFLAAGRVVDAADMYVAAIEDAPDQFARLPEPDVRDTTPMMWEDCLQVTPRGDWLVAGGKDGTVRRWKIAPEGIGHEPEVLHRHENARIVSLAVTDSLVASSCDLGAVWITRDGDGDGEQLVVGDGAETALAITGGGGWLVAAISKDLATQLVAWDAHHAVVAKTHREVGEQPGEFPRLIRCAGDSVAVATKDVDALVWRWRIDPVGHKELGRQQNDVLSLGATANGMIIAYAGVANSSADSPEAAIIDVEAGVRCQLASRQSDSILACALDGRGRILATAERIGGFDESGTVSVWRPNLAAGVASADRVLSYDRGRGDVSVLVVSRKGEWIVAGHERGAVSLWRVTENGGSPFLTFGRGDRVVALRMTPDERWLISGARDGRVMIFDLRRLEMLQRACERAGVTPEIGPDKVTLRDRSATRGPRFPWENVGTASPLPGHPNGALV